MQKIKHLCHPYGDNVGAPSIKLTNIGSFKQEKILQTNLYFEARFNEIKKEYLDLLEAFKWNDLVYSSNFKFEPIKGHIYHLYQNKNKALFLSLIEPEKWNHDWIGTFIMDANNKWIKINTHNI